MLSVRKKKKKQLAEPQESGQGAKVMSKEPSKPDRERNHKQGPLQNTQDLNSGDICKVGPWQGKGSLKKSYTFLLV